VRGKSVAGAALSAAPSAGGEPVAGAALPVPPALGESVAGVALKPATIVGPPQESRAASPVPSGRQPSTAIMKDAGVGERRSSRARDIIALFRARKNSARMRCHRISRRLAEALDLFSCARWRRGVKTPSNRSTLASFSRASLLPLRNCLQL